MNTSKPTFSLVDVFHCNEPFEEIEGSIHDSPASQQTVLVPATPPCDMEIPLTGRYTPRSGEEEPMVVEGDEEEDDEWEQESGEENSDEQSGHVLPTPGFKPRLTPQELALEAVHHSVAKLFRSCEKKTETETKTLRDERDQAVAQMEAMQGQMQLLYERHRSLEANFDMVVNDLSQAQRTIQLYQEAESKQVKRLKREQSLIGEEMTRYILEQEKKKNV